MPLPALRYAKPVQVLSHRIRPTNAFQRSITVSLILIACLALGCGEDSRGSNSNSSATSNQKAAGNANSNPVSPTTSSQFSSTEIQDPERYGIAMTISIQETSSEAPTPMLTQQFDLAKLGADRRWAFVFPAPLGQIVYLEKSGLRYLVLFERKQYAELAPNTFGFELVKVLTPNSIFDRLKSHQFEKLGLEPVNGRTGIKYRLTAASDPLTHMIFVDQETGLPLRSELNAVAPSGTKSRVIVEVRQVQLNPDRAQFDVPAGMKKITQQEARQQIDAFSSALRPFADITSGTQSAPAANVTQPAANKNASRNGR